MKTEAEIRNELKSIEQYRKDAINERNNEQALKWIRDITILKWVLGEE